MCGLPAYGRDYSLKAHSVNTCIYRVYVREFSVVARRVPATLMMMHINQVGKHSRPRV